MSEKKDHLDINNVPIDAELDSAAQLAEELEEQAVPSFKIDSRRDERVFAFNLIYATDRFDYSVELDQVLENFTSGFDVVVTEENFAVRVARDVINNRQSLDEEVTPFLRNWKIDRLGCCTRLILRMAVWEMRLPGAISSIIINEAVELAKMFSEKDAYKFVNGILDEIAKKRKSDSEQGSTNES